MKILLPIDGSPCSNEAVAEVARRPWPAGTEVRIVTVDPPVEPSLLQGGPQFFDELVRLQRTASLQRLADASTVFSDRSAGLRVSTMLLEGNTKDVLITEAERWPADLIVVGSHGYGPIRRFFLGSVSLFLAQHAPCSVEIVRRPKSATGAGQTDVARGT